MPYRTRLSRAAHTMRGHSAAHVGYLRAALLSAAVLLSAIPRASAQASALGLADALTRALESDPGLKSASAAVSSAEAGRIAAGSRPLSTFAFTVEDVRPQNGASGLENLETTLSLSRELERGGRRTARQSLAEREIGIAEVQRLIVRLDLLHKVQRSYYRALAQEQKVRIAEERLATAEQLAVTIDRRVSAARDPLMAGARAATGVAEARVALDRAHSEAANARAVLASYWNGDEGFVLNESDFSLPPARDHDHSGGPESSPDLARLAAERDRADAAIRLERSLAYQNPTVSLGVRRFETDGDAGVVAGFSIPLGQSAANRGALAKSESERRRAEFDLETGRRELYRQYASLERTLSTETMTARSLEETVIPQALRALELAREGYVRGAFSYLDVLDAQLALSNAREARIVALDSYHTTEADLDRLTARFADALPGEETAQ